MWQVRLLWPLVDRTKAHLSSPLIKKTKLCWCCLERTDGVGDYVPCFPYIDQKRSVYKDYVMLQFHDNVWNVNFTAYTMEQCNFDSLTKMLCIPNLHGLVIHIFRIWFQVLTSLVVSIILFCCQSTYLEIIEKRTFSQLDLEYDILYKLCI